jgi:hypothetical protein
MGGDGGTIPRRNDVIHKSQAPKGDRQQTQIAKWTLCSLTQSPLQGPSVDFLGNLLNYDDLVVALSTKSLPPHLAHISRLKDVQRIRIPASCPVSGLTFGSAPFFALSCGCVASGKAIADLERAEGAADRDAEPEDDVQLGVPHALDSCPVCGAKAVTTLRINPPEELKRKMLEDRGKGGKKEKKRKAEADAPSEAGPSEAAAKRKCE